MLFVALGAAGGLIQDGGTPERHSMLLRHTGTQLLCLSCGVALGCLWAPNALLPFQKKNGGIHSLWRRYLPEDRGRLEFPPKKIAPRALLVLGNYRYREIRIPG